MKQQTKTCQNCKQQFTIEPEDFNFYEKIKVPPPTFCPKCRLIRRLSWRNERSLYRRTCGLCAKPILSVYSQESGMNVYCNPCWWSDKWDSLSYGVDLDPSRSFFEQFGELLRRVPVMPLFGLYPSLTNSDYTNMVSYLKNCYFITHSDFNENCAYGGFITNSKECFDNFLIDKCELCYKSVNCRRCYRTFFSLDCKSCHNIWFSRNCVGCSDCFGCVNLRNKKYHIFNTPYSNEEYKKRLEELRPCTLQEIQKIRKKVADLGNRYPQKYMHESHNTNVTGDYIYNSKNTRDSYIVADMEDSRFCSFVTPSGTKDCWDFTHYGIRSELLYESLQGGEGRKQYFTWLAMRTNETEYSAFIVGSNNIFGSVSLKNNHYCILNKQYSKEEYERLRNEIVDHMNTNPYRDVLGNTYRYGEFFPPAICPFAYNETTAQFHFPLTEEGASEKKIRWKKFKARDYQITLKIEELPKKIGETSDSVVNEVIECLHKGECNEGCATAFRVISEELQFYRNFNLPLPQLCPNCRYYQMVQRTNPFSLWHRKCQCAGERSDNDIYQNTVPHLHKDKHCPNEFETSYSPERKEIIYCEKCYQSEVI